jgi:tetratricopeptide (TPR) repeat protein
MNRCHHHSLRKAWRWVKQNQVWLHNPSNSPQGSSRLFRLRVAATLILMMGANLIQAQTDLPKPVPKTLEPPAPRGLSDPPRPSPPHGNNGGIALTPDQKRAREAFLAGKWEEALQVLEAAAKANPNNPMPAKVLLARWSAEAGQLAQARFWLEEAAREDPKHPEVFLTNGHFAFLEGRITDTILNCQAALDMLDTPRWEVAYKQQVQLQARLGLAAAYEARRDFLSAYTQLREILQTDPRNAPLRQRLARLLFLLNRTEEAFQHWQQAQRDDPTLEPAELQLAQLYALRQEFDQAEVWFQKAVANHAEDVRVRRLFAVFLLEQGRRPEARSHLEAVQRLEPNHRDTRALCGYFARHERDYPTAIKIFEELVRDYPSFSFAIVNLALLLAESGDARGKERAVALAENYTRQQPGHADARAVLAYTLLQAGREAEAERVARSALGLSLLSPDGAYFLARVLQARGASDEARSLLQAALRNKSPMFYRKEAENLAEKLGPPSSSSNQKDQNGPSHSSDTKKQP